jgi:Mg-chelatase subunit ChlD
MGTLRTWLTVAIAAGMMATSALQTWSQSFNLYNINTSNFPRITADYSAFDATGRPYPDLSAADFTIAESAGGQPAANLTPSIVHSCKDIVGDPSASVVLVVDMSNSMGEVLPNGRTRLSYTQDAVRNFLNNFKFNGKSSVTILGFSGNTELICRWHFSKDTLIDSVIKLRPLAATKYEAPFENPSVNAFTLLATRDPAIPKFIIFLTDGVPNPDIVNEPAFVARTVTKCQAEPARVFSVTILQTFTYPALQQICSGSGGKSVVTDEAGLVDIMALLALETQVRRVCTLEWTSPYTCSEQGRYRAAAVTLKRNNRTSNVSYQTPPSSIAKVNVSAPVLFCGDPNPNASQTADVTITAANAPLIVSGFTILPNSTYFSVVNWDVTGAGNATFTPFTLPTGASRTLRVQFRQGAVRQFRQAVLQLQGTTCPPAITLVGGQGLVILSTPQGGELYSTCDTVTITWAGVLPSQPVNLDYSEDDGATFQRIASNVTGLLYKWLPPRQGIRYRVRVSVSPAAQYAFAKGFGGTGTETTGSISVCNTGFKIHVGGWFDGPTKFGSNVINNSVGNIDGFYMELDADGNLTRFSQLQGTASNDERVIGVITNSSCDTYICGYYTSPNAQFLSQNFSFPNPALDKSNMFLMKLLADGSYGWAQFGQGTTINASTTNATNLGIRSSGNEDICVTGRFTRYVSLGRTRTNTAAVLTATDNNPRNYYVIYDKDGYVLDYRIAGAPTGFRWMAKTATDVGGFTYEANDFTGSRTFGPYTVTSAGGQDVFVNKYGAPPSSADTSNASFSVKSPILSLTSTSIALDPTPVGQSSTKSFSLILCNNGDFPITITSSVISGVNGMDFALQGSLNGVKIQPGVCVSIEVKFTPSGIGPRVAALDINGTCATPVQLLIQGEGLAPCAFDVVPTVDVGSVAQGIGGSVNVPCLFRNNSPDPLTVSLSVIGANAADFDVTPVGPFTLQPGECTPPITVGIKASAVAGVKTALIEFVLPADCPTAQTTITGEVVQPNVVIENVDYGNRRVGTGHDSVTRVRNLSTKAAEISSLTWTNAADPNFPMPALPGVPFTLQPGESKIVPIRFAPQTRGAHTNTLTATITGQAQPITGRVDGVGIQPKIRATGYTFAAVPVGAPASEQGWVTIYNDDPNTPLYLNAVGFAQATQHFTWGAATTNFPATVAPLDSLRIGVQFSPKVGGLLSEFVAIIHDDTAASVPPYAQTTVIVSGEGLEAGTLTPIDFGRVLTCSTATATFTVVNPSSATPFVIDDVVMTGDVSVFTVGPTGRVVIPPSGSQVFTVTFAPTQPLTYNATIALPNAIEPNLSIRISGTGAQVDLTPTLGSSTEIPVGSTVLVPMSLSIGDLAGNALTFFTLSTTYDADALSYLKTVAVDTLAWQIVTDASVQGVLTMQCTALSASTLTSGNFATIHFTALLTPDSIATLTTTPSTSLSCVIPKSGTATVDIKEVCGNEIRGVQITGQPFRIDAPRPNPSGVVTTIPYSVGFAVDTRFDIVDALGTTVMSIVQPAHPAGRFELTVDLSHISAGTYMVRMSSGPYVESQRMMIIR